MCYPDSFLSVTGKVTHSNYNLSEAYLNAVWTYCASEMTLLAHRVYVRQR
jgi:hypothetical protein